MDNTKLQKLVLKIRNNGDKEAFVQIFHYFAPRIIGYLVGSGSSKIISEEIAQEVLTTVWQKAAQFDNEKGNVSTWIFTIARNKRIDRIRKNEDPSYNSVDLVEALYSNNQTNNDKDLDLSQKIRIMQSKLTEKEREMIKMNFFEGKTHKIISQDLEIPLGTVKSRIRNILLKMKKLEL
jgi:RNA polymerase sigma-70 factor (ECF subfamily)